MKQAVISCLHANLPAVEAVLKDIELQGITNITCLGDLVGYGPQPIEVIELIRDKKISTCQGCWDEDIVDGLDACDCSYPSQLAERFVNENHAEFLKLAKKFDEENIGWWPALDKSKIESLL